MSPSSSPSPAPSIFTPYLTPSLSSHLSHLPPTISLDSLSRTTPARLQRTALPNIGAIELVSSANFQTLYDPLYTASFPRRAERERSDLIVERLVAQARGERAGLAPYRIVGIRDHAGEVIGAAQFSVLPVPPRPGGAGQGQGHEAGQGTTVVSISTPAEDRGGDVRARETASQLRSISTSTANFAVPYLQYIYVRAQNRRQDMSEVLHAMVLAVASADAAVMDLEDGVPTLGADNPSRTVPFTLFETDPPDHGDDHASRAYALERSKIHTSSGGVALVLRRPKRWEGRSDDNGAEDEILSAHVQPGLEPADPPLTLVWVIRPSPISVPDKDYDLSRMGAALIAAYYQSLRDEGFPEKNIRLAERILEQRCKGSTFGLTPLADVKDFSMEKGYLDIREAD
ncbi:hypothetical protein A1O7_07434 [Cladophialophora yegresii CBS 114405]|uniref:Uncharacterized protein n=1 Tax=Cladophialophora yegresii CBS 114405 TaxID=1182544 RepID=W9VWL2_9EURO|nr:uncharacterized protein A1O7_07434 [Cladophialophora yegresii CBS 114405]EXJ57090.1 hypothetical protein A1O7_07434 [Cladophialophora yegresii CBS 114405]